MHLCAYEFPHMFVQGSAAQRECSARECLMRATLEKKKRENEKTKKPMPPASFLFTATQIKHKPTRKRNSYLRTISKENVMENVIDENWEERTWMQYFQFKQSGGNRCYH